MTHNYVTDLIQVVEVATQFGIYRVTVGSLYCSRNVWKSWNPGGDHSSPFQYTRSSDDGDGG